MGALIVFDVTHQATGSFEDGLAAVALDGLLGAVILEMSAMMEAWDIDSPGECGSRSHARF